MVRFRSRFSISLRTLLIGFALLSAIFAWQYHYRGQKIKERDRIRSSLAGFDSYANFRYVILGWEVPEKLSWFWTIAFPEPSSIYLFTNEDRPLADEHYETAQRCEKLEYAGYKGGDDASFRRCTSSHSKEIKVWNNGVSGECLAFVGECPNLRRVDGSYVTLATKSLAALLNHPRIEELVIWAEAEDLSLLGELQGTSALQHLDLHLAFDWRRSKPVILPKPRDPSWIPAPGDIAEEHRPRRASGDFAWLQQCHQLREITHSQPLDADFFKAVGRHLHGVERLNAPSLHGDVLESLATWTRLRHLCLDGLELNDELLSRIIALCPGLHTFESDEYSESKVSLSPDGLRSLRGLKDLKRLHLGWCHLTTEHLAAIAELPQIEELSLEDQSIDDAAVEPLKNLPKLKQINLERTKASKKPFSAIRGDWEENRPYRT